MDVKGMRKRRRAKNKGRSLEGVFIVAFA